MSLETGAAYDARALDEFEVAGQPGRRYRVVDVRPTQIVIEETTTGEPLTIHRPGTATR
jgi:hypothetical protein